MKKHWYTRDPSSNKFSFFPTDFCLDLAKKAELLVPSDNSFVYMDQIKKLKEFEELSVCGKLEDAMVCFSYVELSECQVEALTVIHGSTWARVEGENIGVLLDRIEKG